MFCNLAISWNFESSSLIYDCSSKSRLAASKAELASSNNILAQAIMVSIAIGREGKAADRPKNGLGSCDDSNDE